MPPTTPSKVYPKIGLKGLWIIGEHRDIKARPTNLICYYMLFARTARCMNTGTNPKIRAND
jgi:hypothetical protein